MNRKRMLALLGLLTIVLALRWWDPLGHPKAEQAISAPVEWAKRSAAISTQVLDQPASTDAVLAAAWPVRDIVRETDAGNAFLARGQVVEQAQKQRVVVIPPPPEAYGPPRPPPPPVFVEVPPPLQVIGTWGDASNLAVFLAGPQGTILARQGDLVLSQYHVQSVDKQQLTLLQNSNQRIWNLPIPAAPFAVSTWPSR